MEKFIAASITTVLILVLLMQFVVQDTRHMTITNAEIVIETAVDEAKKAGYFSPAILQEMTDSLNSMGIDASEFKIDDETTRTVKYKNFGDGEMINYKFEILIDETVASPEFFGIRSNGIGNGTGYWHVFEGTVASEALNF